jgi:phosphate transport system substrate-binding protein
MNRRQYLPQLHRRDCLRLLLGAPALTLLAGCGGLGQSEEKLSGQLSIAGATSIHPLIAAAAQSFEHAHPSVTIQLRTSGSLSGLEAMEQHQADITLSDTYADPILYPDLNLSDYLVCIVSFAMIVHPTLAPYISTLSRQQLIDIYSTNKVNWKDVGGPDLPIIPVVRGPESGTRVVFHKLVLGGHDESAQTTGVLVQKNTSVDVVDFVRHEYGAIGYIAVPLVDSSVRTVPLDGVSPTPENILNGKYSFWSYEHVYTLDENRSLISAFLNFLSGSEVQDLVSQLHYLRADSPTLSDLRAPTGYGT